MAPDAIKLLAAMSSMGEEQMSMWHGHSTSDWISSDIDSAWQCSDVAVRI